MNAFFDVCFQVNAFLKIKKNRLFLRIIFVSALLVSPQQQSILLPKVGCL
jgi:hypothetical protein